MKIKNKSGGQNSNFLLKNLKNKNHITITSSLVESIHRPLTHTHTHTHTHTQREREREREIGRL